jgi:uncharacterized protein
MKKTARLYLIAELLLLFVLLPVLYLLDLIPFHKIIPLLVLFLYCFIVLWVSKRISIDRFSIQARWKLIILRFVGINLLIFMWIYFVSALPLWADFASNRKLFYMLLMYPILSAFPQELIFREFFFHRYAEIFKNQYVMLVMNVLLFSFAHIYFGSWIVLIFTLAGGLIFALTYSQTRSLLVVTIEHSLYGLVILSTGLSEHFYKAF